MDNQLLSKIEEILQILKNQISGGNVDNDRYTRLRQQIIKNHSIEEYLPQILKDCRKPLDFCDLDDIGHYARKNYSYWNADEEKYSMRLKEDRKLRKEGWEVFRISNWEIRNEQYISEIVDDLLDYFEIDMSVDSSQGEQISNDFSDIPF